MKIYFDKEKKTSNLKFKGTVQDLLVELKINPETVLVVKNDELIQDDDFLIDSDEVKIITVISGG